MSRLKSDVQNYRVHANIGLALIFSNGLQQVSFTSGTEGDRGARMSRLLR